MTPNQTNVATTTPGRDVAPNSAQTTPGQPQHYGIRRFAWGLAIVVAAFTAIIVYYGIHSRVSAESRLQARTEEAAILTVTVALPKIADQTQEIVLPGN